MSLNRINRRHTTDLFERRDGSLLFREMPTKHRDLALLRYLPGLQYLELLDRGLDARVVGTMGSLAEGLAARRAT